MYCKKCVDPTHTVTYFNRYRCAPDCEYPDFMMKSTRVLDGGQKWCALKHPTDASNSEWMYGCQTFVADEPWKCETCRPNLRLSADGTICSPFRCPTNQWWNSVDSICDYCGVAFCHTCDTDSEQCEPGHCQSGYLPRWDRDTDPGNPRIVDCKAAISDDTTIALNYLKGEIESCVDTDCKSKFQNSKFSNFTGEDCSGDANYCKKCMPPKKTLTWNGTCQDTCVEAHTFETSDGTNDFCHICFVGACKYSTNNL